MHFEKQVINPERVELQSWRNDSSINIWPHRNFGADRSECKIGRGEPVQAGDWFSVSRNLSSPLPAFA
jgi:hypothetical protein